jgi:hypothetical protein
MDHRTVLPEAIPKAQGTYENAYGIRRSKGNDARLGTVGRMERRVYGLDSVERPNRIISCPVELAQYAIERGIQEEPAFAWWLPHTMLKKQKQILKKIKSKYWARTHKYGIRIPKSIKEAIEVDTENGNSLWMDAKHLEMKNLRMAFKEYDGDPNSFVGYIQITGHLVFNVMLGEN